VYTHSASGRGFQERARSQDTPKREKEKDKKITSYTRFYCTPVRYGRDSSDKCTCPSRFAAATAAVGQWRNNVFPSRPFLCAKRNNARDGRPTNARVISRRYVKTRIPFPDHAIVTSNRRNPRVRAFPAEVSTRKRLRTRCASCLLGPRTAWLRAINGLYVRVRCVMNRYARTLSALFTNRIVVVVFFSSSLFVYVLESYKRHRFCFLLLMSRRYRRYNVRRRGELIKNRNRQKL